MKFKITYNPIKLYMNIFFSNFGLFDDNYCKWNYWVKKCETS